MSESDVLSVAVLGSGSGTNLQAVIDAIDAGALQARVACVISDVENAFILERARRRGIPACYVDPAPFRTKLDGEAEMRCIEVCRGHGAEVVALAGFMRMIKRRLLEAFPGHVLNVHPALLPAFPGLEAWKQAVEYGVKLSGCTVHLVDLGMDTGPIILQKTVPVLEDDTPAELHARIQKQEHLAYAEALQLFAERRIRVEGRRVRILPET